MQLLRRPKPFCNETLESYFVRLSDENGYIRFTIMISLLKSALAVNNENLALQLPVKLEQINLYHANTSTVERYKALIALSQLTLKNKGQIARLALMRGGDKYSKGLTSVYRDRITYPRIFLRSSGIPVCPFCLRLKSYIPQYWHFSPYICCHLHNIKMIEYCPECGAHINYMKSLSVSNCVCGFDFSSYEPSETTSKEILNLSYWLVDKDFQLPALKVDTLTQRWGLLLWWYLEQNIEDKNIANCLIDSIPLFFSVISNLSQYFDKRIRDNLEEIEYSASNKSYYVFYSLFGQMLSNAAKLPTANLSSNIVLSSLFTSFQCLCFNSKFDFITNKIRLNTMESALFLGVSNRRMIELIDSGYLKMANNSKSHTSIKLFSSQFTLSDVNYLRLSMFQRGYIE